MNKTDLINKLAERLDGDRKAAQTAVEGLIDLVQREVVRGQNVSISGFGVFEKRTRAPRTARNPRTGEAVKVKKTNVPAFRPGKYFKDVVAGTVKMPKESNTPMSARAAAAAAKTGTPAAPKRAAAARPATRAASTTRATAAKAPARAAGARAAAKPAAAKAAPATRAAAKPAAAKTAAAKPAAAKPAAAKPAARATRATAKAAPAAAKPAAKRTAAAKKK